MPVLTGEPLNYIKGSITAPLGYRAGATKCGIKYPDRYDLAVIVSDVFIVYYHLRIPHVCENVLQGPPAYVPVFLLHITAGLHIAVGGNVK